MNGIASWMTLKNSELKNFLSWLINTILNSVLVASASFLLFHTLSYQCRQYSHIFQSPEFDRPSSSHLFATENAWSNLIQYQSIFWQNYKKVPDDEQIVENLLGWMNHQMYAKGTKCTYDQCTTEKSVKNTTYAENLTQWKRRKQCVDSHSASVISIQNEKALSCTDSKECRNTKPLKRHTLQKNTPSLDGCAFSIRLNDCGEFCGGANLGERQLSHFPSSKRHSRRLLGELLISNFSANVHSAKFFETTLSTSA